jgi:hypothetical protein
MNAVVDRGGQHVFELEQKVTWQGAEAVILAQTVEPSCTIEFADGRRLTVGQSTLKALEETHG